MPVADAIPFAERLADGAESADVLPCAVQLADGAESGAVLPYAERLAHVAGSEYAVPLPVGGAPNLPEAEPESAVGFPSATVRLYWAASLRADFRWATHGWEPWLCWAVPGW